MAEQLPPGLSALIERQRRMARVTVSTGILGTEESTAGPLQEGSGRAPSDPETLAEIAMRHEEGDGVPRRPFLSESMSRYRRQWVEGAMAAMPKSDSPEGHEEQGLRRLGVVMTGDVQSTLRDGPWPPNSPATIAAKRGGDQPLIDTGQLVQSIRTVAEGFPDGATTLVG